MEKDIWNAYAKFPFATVLRSVPTLSFEAAVCGLKDSLITDNDSAAACLLGCNLVDSSLFAQIPQSNRESYPFFMEYIKNKALACSFG